MDDFITTVKASITVCGGLIVGLLGGWDIALQVLVIFVILDYMTGMVAAWMERKLNSQIGLRGLIKKICFFIPVGIGYWIDVLLGTEILRSLAIFFYIANEGLSIIENLGRIGIPVPQKLKDALEQLSKQGEGSSVNTRASKVFKK